MEIEIRSERLWLRIFAAADAKEIFECITPTDPLYGVGTTILAGCL